MKTVFETRDEIADEIVRRASYDLYLSKQTTNHVLRILGDILFETKTDSIDHTLYRDGEKRASNR